MNYYTWTHQCFISSADTGSRQVGLWRTMTDRNGWYERVKRICAVTRIIQSVKILQNKPNLFVTSTEKFLGAFYKNFFITSLIVSSTVITYFWKSICTFRSSSSSCCSCCCWDYWGFILLCRELTFGYSVQITKSDATSKTAKRMQILKTECTENQISLLLREMPFYFDMSRLLHFERERVRVCVRERESWFGFMA